ncbi:MAG TPA: biotin--[acetyl-CoA-carboxylase] ligase [Phycisphaerales bacterium]|nr:biotin--[acetyl-CoA-carboxylase] ligase [Phycisphaerales bacterium]
MKSEHRTMPNAAPIDWQVLNALLRAKGPTNIQHLATQLHSTIDDIRDCIARLEVDGCKFDHSIQGCQLIEAGLGTWGDFLKPITSLTQVYQQTASTQDALRRLIEHHGRQADSAVVVADSQSAGRGRMGRQWLAPPGRCLLFSRAWVGSNADPIHTINRLTFSTAVAMAMGIESVTNLNVSIKWPNDLLIDGKKLAGILVETMTLPNGQLAAMIGVGINVNLNQADLQTMPAEVQDIPMSLLLHNQTVDRLLVLYSVLDALNSALSETDTEKILTQWRKRSMLMGTHISIQHNAKTYTGTVADLDLADGLILRTDHGSLVHLPAVSSTIMT